jgi:S1-C subfamily serine protease
LLAVAAFASGALAVLLSAPSETTVAEQIQTLPAPTVPLPTPAVSEPPTTTQVAPEPRRLDVAVMELADACGTGLSSACKIRRGVAVAALTAGGLADRAGIRRGDIIVEVDDHAIDSPDGLVALVEAAAPGARLDVNLRRLQNDGANVLGPARVTVRLPEQP